MDHPVLLAERVERLALADLHDAATPERRRRLGLVLETVGGALVSIARTQPTILVNRVVGLGVERPAPGDAVPAIVARYAGAGVRGFFLHLDPHARPDSLPRRLAANGLREHHRGWIKFVRGPAPPPDLRTELEVRRIGPESALAFGRIAAEGFGLDPVWAEVVGSLVGRPGWHVYLSFAAGEPAGCGAMRVHDGVAWLDWAATRPAFRGRGSQGAIMARRLADALDLGCALTVTATGAPVPGEPQPSERNILRAGFRASHVRANWVPPVPLRRAETEE